MTAPDPPAVIRRRDRRVHHDRRVLRALGRAFSIVLFIAMLLIALAVVVIPAVAGGQSFTITGDSMSPAYPRGTLVVVRPVDPTELSTGDVITFQLRSGRPEVATHRVQGFSFTPDGTVLITKGDANAETDVDPVRPEQVRGRLWYAVPLIGWVNAVITGPTRAWLVPAAVAALTVYGLWMLATGIRDARRTRRRAATPPADDDADAARRPRPTHRRR